MVENFKNLNLKNLCLLLIRDAPEPTGEEPDDAEFEQPKIYEPVSV